MTILADENVRGDVVAALRAAGHDVGWIQEEDPGIGDAEVLARAVHDDRLLITFDKGDFGALIFQDKRPARGVILFRLTTTSPAELVERVTTTLASRTD